MTLYKNDLPADVAASFRKAPWLAVDTETTGLNPLRDRLCLVQVYDGSTYAAVQIDREDPQMAFNLIETLHMPDAVLIMHHARFDLGMLFVNLGIRVSPDKVYCTRLGDKIARTWAPKHSLANVAQDLLGVTLDKSPQTSDWGADDLDETQLAYAKHDVIHLPEIKQRQEALADRENRLDVLEMIMLGIVPIVVADLTQYNDPQNGLFGY